MLKILNKNINLWTFSYSIVLIMSLLIIGLQIIYYFVYGSKFLDKYTLIGFVLLTFSYYNLFLK
ncbi:hypothetical protein IGL98_000007 [Enterococcus sp. DIV0840]